MKKMKKTKNYKKTHRFYIGRNFEYKSIHTYHLDTNGILKEIFYSITKQDKFIDESIEIYQGKNYIPGGGNSYSRCYPFAEVPKKFKEIANELKKIYQSVSWETSDKENIDYTSYI